MSLPNVAAIKADASVPPDDKLKTSIGLVFFFM